MPLQNQFSVKLLVIFTLLHIPVWLSVASPSPLDTLLIKIDQALDDQNTFVRQKELFIKKIKAQLEVPNLNHESQYLIYKQLNGEYANYQVDSLKLYTQKQLEAAIQTANKEWINDSKINLAMVQAKAGFFQQALHLLSEINRLELTRPQLIKYYIAYSDTYLYWIEFNDGIDVSFFENQRSDIRDSLIALLQVDSYEYAVQSGLKAIDLGQYQKAEALLLQVLPQLQPDSRDYAVLNSLLAHLYEQKGDVPRQKEYLALSALADIEGGIMENTSLRLLAMLLFNDGEVQRANRYIKKCLDDANFFNARLRNLQTSRILPIIDKAYQDDRARQEQKQLVLLTVISVLSAMLFLVILFMIRQMVKLSKAQKRILQINGQLTDLNHHLQMANEKQKETNSSLAEANHIKEQFISNFLEICTEYIEKLEKLKFTIQLKIKAGQMNDVLRLTDSNSDSSRELKELYENFDRAFLNIYPNFIDELNKLLRVEEHYKESLDGSLNQELRVFALIRLGITDNNRIATFLHYTLRTIYNYRSKVKAKAVNPGDNFEDKIKHLCA